MLIGNAEVLARMPIDDSTGVGIPVMVHETSGIEFRPNAQSDSKALGIVLSRRVISSSLPAEACQNNIARFQIIMYNRPCFIGCNKLQ